MSQEKLAFADSRRNFFENIKVFSRFLQFLNIFRRACTIPVKFPEKWS